MSAILGLVDLEGGEVDPQVFRQSLDVMKRYGPDHSDALVQGSAAFGVHVFQVTGHQSARSIKNDNSHIWIAADAILDNRAEVARMLQIDTKDLDQVSDPDLIRLSYEQFGDICVELLDGDFAFACFDSETQELFLARDHIGSRPLYWSRQGNRLLFSSSIEAIVSFREFNWRINENAVARYLASPFSVASESYFSGIFSVPPGGFLKSSRSGELSGKWWSPSKRVSQRAIEPHGVVSECRRLLNASIAKRSTSIMPIGSHFSGGVDSTGISVIAARTLKTRNKELAGAYMWAPSVSEAYPADKAHDERKRISPVVEAEKIAIRFGSSDPVHLLSLIQRPMEFETHSDLADELPILEKANSDGVRILLSGWGGDEVFSSHGMGYFANLLFRGRFSKAAQLAHKQYPSLKKASVLRSIFWRNILPYLLPNWMRRFVYRQKVDNRKSFASAELKSKYSKAFKHSDPGFSYGLNPNKNIRGFVTFGHVEMRMEAWASWSADHQIQYRYPLTDKALLEFLFALHPDDLYLNNSPRGLAKAVLADVIPQAASKSDPANERHRADKRRGVLFEIAKRINEGYYSDECPWIDKNQFFKAAREASALEGRQQDYAFTGVFAAARAWEMYRRAKANSWV